MKKLKIKSPLDIIILFLFVLSLIYSIQSINISPKSIYNNKTKIIKGVITNCQKYDNYYQITIKSKEKVLVTYQKKTNCKLGAKIIAKGKMTIPNKNTIFNQFNYKKYLYSEKIKYIMVADTLKITNSKIQPYQIKNNLQNYINHYQNKEYLNAFILGNTKNINKEVIKSY